MPNYATKALFDTMRTINSASFNGSYQALGSVITVQPRFFLFVNNSGVLVTISDDGTNDKFVILPGSAFTFDVLADGVTNTKLTFPANTQWYAKGSASTGLVYMTIMYAH